MVDVDLLGGIYKASLVDVDVDAEIGATIYEPPTNQIGKAKNLSVGTLLNAPADAPVLDPVYDNAKADQRHCRQ